MSRWTQPQEVREYARVAHAFIDAMAISMNLLVIDRANGQHTGRLVRSSLHQDPNYFPPRYAGDFIIQDQNGNCTTFDIIDVQDVFPLLTPSQAAAQIR